MATTSSNLVANKVAGKVAGQGSNDNGNNGRYGLKAKLAAGVAILGCAAALAFGGAQLDNQGQRQPQVASSAAALPAGTDDLATTGCVGTDGPFACQVGQSLAGTDDFVLIECVQAPGPFACADATLPVSNVAWTQTEAGVGIGARVTPGGLGPRAYLDGEGPTITLPPSPATTQPALQFGPQP